LPEPTTFTIQPMSSTLSDPRSVRVLLLVNGPNLGRLGQRKPEVYGKTTLADIEGRLAALAEGRGWRLCTFQSNHEGALVDFLEAQRGQAHAMVLNPGALMMNGWSLRDAVEDLGFPWFEVHISNVWAREPFRHASILSPLAGGVVVGMGLRGYDVAALELMEHHDVHVDRL